MLPSTCVDDAVGGGSGVAVVRGPALVDRILRHAQHGKVREQFEFEVHRKQIRPQVLVDYFRQ